MNRIKREITSIELTKKQTGLWYLGQEGFVIKHNGLCLAVDPYLSDYVDKNCCEFVQWKRLYPAPVKGEELDFLQAVLCTHTHYDHTDPWTLPKIAQANPNTKFVIPAPEVEALAAYGIERERIIPAYADKPLKLGGFTVTPVPSAHETFHTDAQGNYKELGYIIDDGCTRIFHFDDELKTKTSERTLPLLPAVEEVLLRHKAQIEENKKFYGDTYDTRYLDYVCVEENGKIVYPDHMSKQFSKLLKENNLRHIRLHDLRHSCASNLLASGVPLKEIQEWLGHANFSTTADVYSHLDFSAKVKAGKLISAAYGDEKPTETVIEPPKEQDTMAIFAQAIKEMQELGFEKLEDYLAYKETEGLKQLKKNPPVM